jgi:hypothetical protein
LGSSCHKPVVPAAAFGLAVEEIFIDEQRDFERRYGRRLLTDDYEILNRVLLDELSEEMMKSFAKDVVSIAEQLIVSTEFFVIMSFAEEGHLQDAYDTFCQV